MSDYKTIYGSGKARANSLLEEGQSALTDAKVKSTRLEELSALLALRNVEEKKFNKFKKRYDDILNDESLSSILQGVQEGPREAYRSRVLTNEDGLRFKITELESRIMYKNMNSIDQKTLKKYFERKDTEVGDE